MICKQCGNELKEGVVFCTNCGAKQSPEAPERVITQEDDEKTIGIFGNIPASQAAPKYAEPKANTCKTCGAILKEGAVFCTSCGAKQSPEAPERVITQDDDEKTVGIFGNIPASQAAPKYAEPKANTCKTCGAVLKEGAVFCTNCGTNQNETVNAPENDDTASDTFADSQTPNVNVCKNCGAELTEGAVFCTNCGANQNESSEFKPDMSTSYQNTDSFTGTNPNQSYNTVTGVSNNGHVSFGEAIKLFFVNYVNFTGRASKSEYWWGFLFQLIVLGVTTWIPVVGRLVALGVFLPGLSLNIRRLHDIGKAWYYLLMGLIPLAGIIILIVYYCQESDGDNKWGQTSK